MASAYTSSPAEAPIKIQQSANAAPSVSFTPTETTIPHRLYDKVPNLDLYKKLHDAEQQLDLFIAQKGLDFQSVQASSMQPANNKRQQGVLRVFIYNTCENMPWQKSDSSDSAEAKWTLRIEGVFSGEGEALKFSSFLSGASIELIPNSDYPALQNSQSNIIEWKEQADGAVPGSSTQWQFDGIDVKRAGVFPIKAKIALMIKDHSSRLVLSPQMAQFTGRREASQQELVFSIWQYVLYKNLFKKADSMSQVSAVASAGIASQTMGKDDENDLALVQCDAVLKPLLLVDSFKFKDLYKLIQPHLRPRQPIVIDYEVDTTRSTTLGDVVLDIPVELPLSFSKVQREIIEGNKSTFENMAKSDAHIQHLNQKISLGIASLHKANAREMFYRELSEDPVEFLQKWLESQAETLKALKSEEGYNEENVRKAQYFKENEELLRQKIDLMLGAQKM
ncbi:putative transcription regulatory protein [Clavispora lusitaniae]|uniref:DM2 domain-containing protein n=3 Tax=Clavispora lusitaniae TaxID=36911 RepID=C4YCI8_CLAL4|nr:uncharacterized protein CLUG_05827 [Clavispora lusitaniae ATCC 42720]KAF5208663.1 SWI/SNF complex component snf12 [Clavispora lusitaniae]EEQ41699.1 hypothetical protein CLUG_05827 [Clavispora lusitaniae ATCC 42720]KAF7580520.1 SWIB/MDM2 domain family protein [Clavispora lusitaniae]OVF09330.1 putative transcription regulatory protein [Clavispora lusitaniae]QFZ30394.1 putative transcription regulatory protein [Clavispora lusitaniae]